MKINGVVKKNVDIEVTKGELFAGLAAELGFSKLFPQDDRPGSDIEAKLVRVNDEDGREMYRIEAYEDVSYHGSPLYKKKWECRLTDAQAACAKALISLQKAMKALDKEKMEEERKRQEKEQQVTVKTELGNLVAYPSVDPNHPGIYINLKHGQGDGIMLTMTELCRDEADLSEGPHIITRVWDDWKEEEYSNRIVHKGIK